MMGVSSMAKKFKILMVEDEPAHAELVSRAFEKDAPRFDLAVATNLGEAKEYLSGHNPDLVLVDLLLPDGMGVDLLPGKYEEALYPVVVMTSHGDEKAAVDAMKAGALDYIVKSEVTMRDMPHLVSQALREWHHITERKRAEASLAEEKERLAVTLRSIGDAVITTDVQGRITMMNKVAEHLTGWRQKEALGEPLEKIFNIINENTRKQCDNPVAKVLETGGIVGLANNTVLVGKDRTERVIEDSGAPILDHQNRTLGVVLVFRDATEKRRMQGERQKAQKLESIGILAGGIAHDFNNFLTGILGNLSLIQLDIDPGDSMYPRLKDMEKAALRAKNLTEQLLTFSKGGEPVKRLTQIDTLVREASQFAVRGSNVRCQFDFPDDLWPSEVDAGQLGQVVHNLVINAVQVMPEGGVITISVKNTRVEPGSHLKLLPGLYIRIMIEDHGTGIKKDHLDKIFDPYFTTKQKGSGLGLTIVYSIIEKHDGHVTVYSKLGQGTTLNIYLPASPGSAVKSPKPEETMISGAGRILVMDDEPFIQTLASRMLGKMGYESELAKDGAEAIKKYQKAIESNRPFDAVILDLTVPGGMGGQETITKLIQIDRNVKVIVSSGYSTDPVMSNYRDYGFVAAVRKPYVIKELNDALKKIR